jgi:phage terminase small subunit
MTGHGEKITRCQDKAIMALLTCETIAQAAAVAGVSESTLLRWLKDPSFKAAYLEVRREAVSQAVSQLQRLSSEAVRTLQEVMSDTEAKHTARVTAARTVLDMAIKGVEIEDLQARLEELEEAAGSNGRR